MTKTTIAVYGASGFTGALTVAELRRRGARVLPVGRSADRLSARGFPKEEVRVAALDDPDGLIDAFRGCAVVVNCAGPFRYQGEPVIRAAIAAGCHYLDITGEQGYLYGVFERLTEPARAAGVAVLPAMTDDGGPGDLIASLAAALIDEPDEVTVADLRVGGVPSRGTVRSGWVNADELASAGLTYVDGRWRDDRPTPAERIELPVELELPAETRTSSGTVAVRPIPLPGVVTVPRHVPARIVRSMIRQSDTEVDRAWDSLTPEVIDALPPGPTLPERQASRWLMAVRVTGTRGGAAHGVAYGTDPYSSTAAIASEAAVRLVVDGAAAGVLAPSMAFDAAEFLNSLEPFGVRWRVLPPAA